MISEFRWDRHKNAPGRGDGILQFAQDVGAALRSSERQVSEIEVQVLATDPVMHPKHHAAQIRVAALGGIHMHLESVWLVTHKFLG